jgi:ElaB/YqjD/DUF883 family membrane-anchored ribosome-binding protein
MSELTTGAKSELMSDLNAVIQDTEDLLKLSANQAGEGATALRERARLRLTKAKDSLHDLQHWSIDKAKAAGHRTDDYVLGHPWQSVGIAAGIGLLLGMLISRR